MRLDFELTYAANREEAARKFDRWSTVARAEAEDARDRGDSHAYGIALKTLMALLGAAVAMGVVTMH